MEWWFWASVWPILVAWHFFDREDGGIGWRRDSWASLSWPGSLPSPPRLCAGVH